MRHLVSRSTEGIGGWRGGAGEIMTVTKGRKKEKTSKMCG